MPADLEPEAAYRKRAETADLVIVEGKWHEVIREAVHWPNEGYGGRALCRDREHALATARSSLKQGYGRDPAKNTVRIVETRTRVIEVRLADPLASLPPPPVGDGG